MPAKRKAKKKSKSKSKVRTKPSKASDPLFEEFVETLNTEIAKEFPSLRGCEFDENRLSELFHHYLTIVVYANVPITPAVGQMLAVLKLDPEEEYEIQGNEDLQRELAYPLAEVFRQALEPFRQSDYAKRERAKPKDTMRKRVEEWQQNQPYSLPVELKNEVIPVANIEFIPKEPEPEFVVHDEEGFTSFTFRGKRYDVGAPQGKAIKLLYEAGKAGRPDVSLKEIREVMDLLPTSKVKDSFRRTGLWKTLLVSKKRNTRRLDIFP